MVPWVKVSTTIHSGPEYNAANLGDRRVGWVGSWEVECSFWMSTIRSSSDNTSMGEGWSWWEETCLCVPDSSVILSFDNASSRSCRVICSHASDSSIFPWFNAISAAFNSLKTTSLDKIGLRAPSGITKYPRLVSSNPTNRPGKALSASFRPASFTIQGAPKILILERSGTVPVCTWKGVIFPGLDFVGHLFRTYAAYFRA